MTFKQAVKMDYESLVYSQFICTTALYKRQPYRCLCYGSESDAMTIIIFSKTQSGTTVTRHLKFLKSAAGHIIERLQNDFDLQVEQLDAAEEDSAVM